MRAGTRSPAPIDAVGAALEAAAAALQERREYARQRQAVISANAELQRRELIKLASLSAALADTLRRRGTDGRDFSLLVRESLDELKAVIGAR